MAAFIIRHRAIRSKEISSNFLQTCRHLASKQAPVPQEILGSSQSLESFKESLSSKGFLRSQKPYTPPADVQAKLEGVIKAVNLTKHGWESTIDDPAKRYELLSSCFKEFQHGIPNSMLHSIQTLGDLLEFYQTPVSTTTPLDAMKQMDLPPNLHVQYEYHRFHPDTDTMFGGVSAFPKSSTIVTGLKYKKKYPGFKAKSSWP